MASRLSKKVITSKFRFHLIAIYALGCFRNFSCTPVPTKITLKSPNPHETSERMNFNDIAKKTFNLKTVYILISDVFFFIKKMSQNVWATIMPFGPVTLIFYWPKYFFSGTAVLSLHE